LPVAQNEFSDAALVILGHGSTQNVESAAAVFQHAAELRRRNLFAEVREAFWKQDPNVAPVLAALSAPRVFVAPLFVSEGYFGAQVIPRELGFGSSSRLTTRNSKLFYCRPVGTHDAMAGVLLARARDVVAQFPFPRPPRPVDTTLFVAGHGTGENENSRLAIERLVELTRGLNQYAAVHGVFLEEDPRIAECYRLAETNNIVVVPFFISDGMHTREDIPVLLGEPKRLVQERLANGRPTWHNPTERRGKLVWYAPAVGTDARVVEVILDRVREAALGNE
jgi:sirohydrochlorin cobaltochelatase